MVCTEIYGLENALLSIGHPNHKFPVHVYLTGNVQTHAPEISCNIIILMPIDCCECVSVCVRVCVCGGGGGGGGKVAQLLLCMLSHSLSKTNPLAACYL